MNAAIFTILLFVATALAAIYPLNDDNETEDLRVVRALPTHIVPLRYAITITPAFATKKFTGALSIDVQVKEAKNTITLNQHKLTMIEADVSITPFQNTTNITLSTKVELDDPNQILTITFATPLPIGYYRLTFKKYEGILSDTEREGFYLAKYKDKTGEHTFATTQFQDTAARKAFPCFDEPEYKTTFIIQIVRPKAYISLSNEELLTQDCSAATTCTDTFRETRMMSTYLVAFVVSEYSSTELQKGQRVYADKDSIDNGEALYALQTGIAVINAMESYTGIRYPFSKLDQIAIPDDYFKYGAMENWGLITYLKSRLVYPYDQATSTQHKGTMNIISHELAHQWFGNMVTCKTWMYTWLNEGFADYFEYFIPVMLNWDMEGLFVLESVQRSLKEDSDENTTPMNSLNAKTIIRYQKAGSVIRMLSSIVTPNLFKKSLQHYLKTYAYKAVTPSELYKSVQEILEQEGFKNLTNNVPVADIMQTWDSQAGYPLLSVTRNDSTGATTLEQKRFYAVPPATPAATIWKIPINYVVEADPNANDTVALDWLNSNTKKITLPKDGWVLFNKQQTGYYRVMYDDTNWKLLSGQLDKNHTAIHTFNKAQLLDDIFTFASLNLTSYTIAMDFTKYLKKEKEHLPITVFLNHIEVVDTKLNQTLGRDNFKKYLVDLLNGAALEGITMNERATDSITESLLRVELMKWLCKFGHQQCKSYASEAFKAKAPISPTMQSIVYCGAIRAGGQAEWDQLYEMYNSTTDQQHRSRILSGLGCSENQHVIIGFLEKSLNLTYNLPTSASFKAVVDSGDVGVKHQYNYVIANFTKFVAIDHTTVLANLAKRLTTKEEETKFEELARNHPNQAVAINQAKKFITENIKWNEDNGYTLKTFVDTYVSNIPAPDGGGGSATIQFDFSLRIVLATIVLYITKNIIV